MCQWRIVRKCCCCISLTVGTKLIGTLLFLITLGLFVTYLHKIDDVRDFILSDIYDIPPCVIPIEGLIDTCFEYSILANLCLIFFLKSCSRWLLIPWLVVYFIDIILLIISSILIFIYPPTTSLDDRNLYRLFGLIPLFFSFFIIYCWFVIRSHFLKLGKQDKDSIKSCCPIQMKTGVQIIGGLLAVLSGTVLVLFFAMLDEIIGRKYFQIYERNISRTSLTLMAGCQVLSILVNILLILGGSGSKWRRSLAIPWLLFYGVGIIICLVAHAVFSSKCFIEEKIVGMVSLGIGFVFLIIWTMVWIVAAQVSEKHKTLISVPSGVAFQRL